MGVIARRLQDTGELWRHVYKSLLLLEYMLKHGPQKVGPRRPHEGSADADFGACPCSPASTEFIGFRWPTVGPVRSMAVSVRNWPRPLPMTGWVHV